MKPMRTELRLTIEHVKYVVILYLDRSDLNKLSEFFRNQVQSTIWKVHMSIQFGGRFFTSHSCYLYCCIFGFRTGCHFCVLLFPDHPRVIFRSHCLCGGAFGQCEDDRTKQRLTKLLISVTVAFYVCFIPYGSFILYIALEDRSKLISNQETLSLLLRVFEFLMFCSSCLKPSSLRVPQLKLPGWFQGSFHQTHCHPLQ